MATNRSRQFSVTEISRWYWVPPHKIGDLARRMTSRRVAVVLEEGMHWTGQRERDDVATDREMSDREFKWFVRALLATAVVFFLAQVGSLANTIVDLLR